MQKTKIIKIIIFTAAVLWLGVLAVANGAQAATYYVCDTGATCAVGNPTGGWEDGDDTRDKELAKSRTTPWANPQKATEFVRAGDTVIVGDGIYTDTGDGGFDAVITLWGWAGSEGEWITFKSENKWGAVIDAEGTNYGIRWWSGDTADYIRIEGFEIKNAIAAGIYMQNSEEVDPITKIPYLSDPEPEIDHVYFYNNLIHDNGRQPSTPQCLGVKDGGTDDYGRAGIFIGDSVHHVTVDSNVIHTNGRVRSGCDDFDFNHDHGIYSRGHTLTVINNVFWDHEAGMHMGFANPYFPYLTGYHDITVSNNTISGYNPGRTGYGIAFTGGNTYINPSNPDSALPTNILIQNNIITGQQGILGVEAGSMRIAGWAENVTVRNNLVDTNVIWVEDSECYSPTDPRRGGVNSETDNQNNANPLFTDADNNVFTLTSLSPAIDNGISTNAPITDYAGFARPFPTGGFFDIGAYEYQETIDSPADVNNDGIVNSQDITFCVNVILGLETTPAIVARAKAVTEPLDSCDILDLQAIVNEILK